MPNTPTYVLSTSTKHMIGALGKCFGSTLLTAVCFCQSSHHILLKSCVRVGEVKLQLLTVGVRLRNGCDVCCVTNPLHSLYELDRQSQPSRRGFHYWKLISRLLLADDLVLLASSEQGLQRCADSWDIWGHSIETTFMWDHFNWDLLVRDWSVWEHIHLSLVELRPVHLNPFSLTFPRSSGKR